MSSLSLHDAQTLLAHLDRETDPEQVREAIKAGVDVYKRDNKDKTPLRRLLENNPGGSTAYPVAFELLTDGGVNPLMHDCPYQLAISDGGNIMEIMGTLCVENRAQAEDGSNVFHFIALHMERSSTLDEAVRLVAEAVGMGKKDLLLQGDRQGNTPLHTLWQKGVAIALTDRAQCLPSHPQFKRHWQLHEYFTHPDCGGVQNLGLVNQAGQRIDELIRQAFERGMPLPPKNYACFLHVKSLYEARTLDRDTPHRTSQARKRL